MQIKRTSFGNILPIWQQHLWPNRQSAIETHSAMTWPFEGDPDPIDMHIFSYPATFWCVLVDEQMIGVNSGHRTSDTQYRSRGIWVHPDWRGQHIADLLFSELESQALLEGCELIWSIPRKTALRAYTKFGFQTVGDFIGTETSDANIYAVKRLPLG